MDNMATTDYTLPVIEHATVSFNQWNRVVIQMDDGWVFYDKNDYRDENGELFDPEPDEICYSRYAVYSPEFDFDQYFVVVDETTVPAIQIYGIGDKTETV